MSLDGDRFGPCCVCGGSGQVRTFVMLPKRSPHGHGWGCVVCGLPSEGATYILCDGCAADPRAPERLRFYCIPQGSNYTRGRAPIEELADAPPHRHDLRRHSEED